MRARTFNCMGTVISLTLPQASGEDELVAATAVVERLFAGLDETFSLYRPESEASRLARAEVRLRRHLGRHAPALCRRGRLEAGH